MVDYSYMDTRQKTVHEHFGADSYLHDSEFVWKFVNWVTYWRRNPGRFVEYYFGLSLHLYQHIILILMEYFPSICIVATRSAAKSFIVAVYACKEAVLRPGARVVIASSTKKQARLIVSEKIKKEIVPKSPLLEREIKSIKDSNNDIEVVFWNGSSIVVVVADDNARGYRATVLIYEEFRMIKKFVIDSVLSPFLYARQAGYLMMPEYAELIEEPKEIYISSAWYTSHWMWKLMNDFAKDMVNGGGSCLIAMDYVVPLMHNIKTRSYLLKEKRKLDSATWQIEYANLMLRENLHSYFSHELLNQNRTLKRPFYPRKDEDVLGKTKNKYAIPKQPGEIRLVACDIAASGGSQNDNSVYLCMRLMPEHREIKYSDRTGEHIQVQTGYRRQVPYLEAANGGETAAQAIRIKQLYYDFDADYCVLDVRNMGISLYDCLAKVLYDEDRNVEYAPWS